MSPTMPQTALETEGNAVADRFPVTKRDAILCFKAAYESFLAAHNLSLDQLAEDLCGMSKGNFSKVANGVQGDFLDLVYNRVPADIRTDFVERCAELERVDPVNRALEQLVLAAMQMIRVARPRLPQKARPAKAGIHLKAKAVNQ